MRPPINLRELPASLLLLLSVWPQTVVPQEQSPYDHPPHRRYFPEDEVHVKRQHAVQSRLLQERPIAVRKMSLDEGEKFYLDYWEFESENQDKSRRWINTFSVKDSNQISNASISTEPDVALRLLDADDNYGNRMMRMPRNIFKRDFQCPGGTNACLSINRPNSCCSTSSTCVLIEDTGLGDVGCCPSGKTCTGSVSTCPADYTSCPDSSNGGCCIPGYSCQDVGCVYVGTEVVTTIIPTVVVPQPSSSSTAPVLTPSSSPFTSAAPSTSSLISLTCPASFTSCPVSLGGGCCLSGRSCASDILCSPTGTASASAPVRPTSDVDVSTITTTENPSSSGTVSVCPTGFYMCSAYYRGDCCRVGRNCDSTSCPTSASTAVVVSNGVTIVAPTGASLNPGSAVNCATGWYSCAASLGGDCCPNGYACGTASCTATQSGGGSTGKEAPNSQGGRSGEPLGWVTLVLGVVSGLGMLLL